MKIQHSVSHCSLLNVILEGEFNDIKSSLPSPHLLGDASKDSRSIPNVQKAALAGFSFPFISVNYRLNLFHLYYVIQKKSIMQLLKVSEGPDEYTAEFCNNHQAKLIQANQFSSCPCAGRGESSCHSNVQRPNWVYLN